jgi:hypothetical protein
MEKILKALQERPDGVTLADLGNALGVNWRSLIGVVGRLMEEEKIGNVDNVYYPVTKERMSYER